MHKVIFSTYRKRQQLPAASILNFYMWHLSHMLVSAGSLTRQQTAMRDFTSFFCNQADVSGAEQSSAAASPANENRNVPGVLSRC